MSDRRRFLKMFGVTTAAIGATTLNGTEIEKVTDQTVTPLVIDPEHIMDVRHEPLYSALVLDPGWPKERHQFFGYSLGMANPYATPWVSSSDPYIRYSETNMQMANRLSAPRLYCVKRIGVLFSPTSDRLDRVNFIENASLSLWMGQKRYWRGPLAMAHGIGIMDRHSNVPASAMAELDVPLIITTEMRFYAELDVSQFQIKNRIKLWAVLDGLHALEVS